MDEKGGGQREGKGREERKGKLRTKGGEGEKWRKGVRVKKSRQNKRRKEGKEGIGDDGGEGRIFHIHIKSRSTPNLTFIAFAYNIKKLQTSTMCKISKIHIRAFG